MPIWPRTRRSVATNGRTIHPLQLALAVQDCLGENDWLVFDGGNTHFWAEIAVNLSGWKGKPLAGMMHPGAFSMLGVGVSFALSAKNTHPAQYRRPDQWRRRFSVRRAGHRGGFPGEHPDCGPGRQQRRPGLHLSAAGAAFRVRSALRHRLPRHSFPRLVRGPRRIRRAGREHKISSSRHCGGRSPAASRPA